MNLQISHISIEKDNRLRLQVTCQPGVMKQILDGCCWLIFGFINFNPDCVVFLDLSFWVQAEQNKVFFGWCPYCKWTHQIHTELEPGAQWQILLFWVGEAHISCMYVPSLSFDILDKWNINHQRSTSCVRPCHAMVFLIVFSVFCSSLSRMK
jgi:hypothetical protein